MTHIKPLEHTQGDKEKPLKIKTLLVPTDFSEAAHNAFEYALHIASDLQAKIVLLHVYQEVPLKVSCMPLDFIKALKEKKIGAAEEAFDTYKTEAVESTNKEIQVETLLKSGNIRAQIIHFAEKLKADMIIMGTQGAASLEEGGMGSVTNSLIEWAPCPILAIPAETSYQPIEQIMYATSLSQWDLPIIAQLGVFAQALNAKLICTHISAQNNNWEALKMDSLEQLTLLEEAGEIQVDIEQQNDVFHGLQTFINQHKIDILAMTTYKDKRIKQWDTPSLTSKMVLYTDIPLLAFRKNHLSFKS